MKLVAVSDVKRGRSTDILKRSGRDSKSASYFSLVTADRTLDFCAPSPQMATFIATRITILIIDARQDEAWLNRYYDELEENGEV